MKLINIKIYHLFFFFVFHLGINSQWLENENGIYYLQGSVGIGLPAPIF